MKKLAVFDLDGTLLNTLDDLAQACNHALKAYGLPEHPAQAYKRFVGNGVKLLIKRAVPPGRRGDTVLLEQVESAFDSYYKQHDTDLTAPYEGILELLEQLSRRGVTLAVLSNKPHPFTAGLVRRFFGGRMAVAHGQREGFPTKPDCALVEEILRMTGFSPDETIYIGDSGVDMQTAKNAGVYAVGVLWGFRDRQELEENGADVCVACPEEICGLV